MPGRKSSTDKAKEEVQTPVASEEQNNEGLASFLRFGESYTSLILGIVVVIIATVLLLSFVHNNNLNKSDNVSQSQLAKNISAELTQAASTNKVTTETTAAPTKAPVKQKTIIAMKPTDTPTPTVTKAPTATPTVKVAKQTVTKAAAKPTVTKVMAKASPTVVVKKQVAAVKVKAPAKIANKKSNQKIYIVRAGDSLWQIAESEYKSGYNWVDIAKANNLADPSNIHKDDRLVIPNVSPKIVAGTETQVTSTPEVGNSVDQNNQKITDKSYTVQKGDNLWSIAVRAYGDGYQYTKIAQSNNLTDPSTIHSGNVLQIPR